MTKHVRHLIAAGCVVGIGGVSALLANDASPEAPLKIQITYANGRMLVTNAPADNEPFREKVEAVFTPPQAVLDARMPEPIQALVHTISQTHGVDPHLVAAVMKVESNYDRWARSSKGALGLMQLIPATGRRFGVRDFFDPAQNIEGGVRYLRFLTDRFGAHNLDLLLAAYNAGENRVERAGGVPAIRETRDYVRKIRTIYRPPATPAAAAVKAAPAPVEPAPEPPVAPVPTIYKTVDARGVIHFSNLGPPH
jgi:soluble lytic murein transglycosylase-like protein